MTGLALALWRIARIAPLVAVPCVSFHGCQSSATPNEAPPDEQQTEVTTRPLTPPSGAPLAQPGADPAGVNSTGSSAPGDTNAGTAATSVGERPSVDENMGRGFQGKLKLLLRTASGEHGLRYLARGNRARLQIDAPDDERRANEARTPINFDALIWDQHISLLNHRDQTFQTFALDDVEVPTEPELDVDIERTGQRVSVLGVFCERYEITQGLQKISACVSALPGAFDVGKLEAVSGIDVPAWAEALLEEKMMPLTASARGSESGQNYSIELLEYSPGPAPESALTLPSTYREKSRPIEASP